MAWYWAAWARVTRALCTSQDRKLFCPSPWCPSWASNAASSRAHATAHTASACSIPSKQAASAPAGRLAASRSASSPTSACSFSSVSEVLAGSAMVHMLCLTSLEGYLR